MPSTTRRRFLQGSTAAMIGTAAAMSHRAHAAEQGTLRVGLIGCGGRGTGAAAQALAADPQTKLHAMGDAFGDRLTGSLEQIAKQFKDQVDVSEDRRFVGIDAYKKVIEQSDVVLLATPPHFRPMHLRAAVEAGKHVFAEKPVAVDGPGVRSVLESCRMAEAKGLSIVSGLCMRYNAGFAETIKRVQDGAIGRPITLQANDYRGTLWVRPREEGQSDLNYQMRNWYYFTWLSGDFNVEQHVHMLDLCAWTLGDRYPVKAIATGGRQQRTGPEHGNIYDHFSVTYTYDDDTKLHATCRQQRGCKSNISVEIAGAKGHAILSSGGRSIQPHDGEVWRDRGKHKNHYQVEHDRLFEAIRSGKPINNGDYMSKSTMVAILGRMAAYSGQEITWDRAMASTLDLSPPHYDWDKPLPPARPVAIPGLTDPGLIL